MSNDKITCSHIDANGNACDNSAKEDYGMQYCGHHKEDFYLGMLATLETSIKDLECDLECARQCKEDERGPIDGILAAAFGIFLFILGLGVGYLL